MNVGSLWEAMENLREWGSITRAAYWSPWDMFNSLPAFDDDLRKMLNKLSLHEVRFGRRGPGFAHLLPRAWIMRLRQAARMIRSIPRNRQKRRANGLLAYRHIRFA